MCGSILTASTYRISKTSIHSLLKVKKISHDFQKIWVLNLFFSFHFSINDRFQNQFHINLSAGIIKETLINLFKIPGRLDLQLFAK